MEILYPTALPHLEPINSLLSPSLYFFCSATSDDSFRSKDTNLHFLGIAVAIVALLYSSESSQPSNLKYEKALHQQLSFGFGPSFPNLFSLNNTEIVIPCSATIETIDNDASTSTTNNCTFTSVHMSVKSILDDAIPVS